MNNEENTRDKKESSRTINKLSERERKGKTRKLKGVNDEKIQRERRKRITGR